MKLRAPKIGEQRPWPQRRLVAAVVGIATLSHPVLCSPASDVAPAIHIFAYADSLHPSLCTLSSSVEAIGGRLNIIGLDDGDGIGAVPREALIPIADSLAEHGRHPSRPGQRASATIDCRTRQDCATTGGLLKIRKFLSLRSHLDHFDDEDVVLFLDGFDVVLEAPSLPHIRASFERLQRRIAPLIQGAPPGGPVIFNGEGNCWPFPHSWGDGSGSGLFTSGDYRPRKLYRFANGSSVRGAQVCELWRRQVSKSSADADVDGARPLRLPYINSGVFMGRVGSIRRLYESAVDTLKTHGEFEDQGLVYVIALAAAFDAPRPWTPLWVDSRGELLASLHGLSLPMLARRLNAPEICEYMARVSFGYYAASLEAGATRPSRWSADGARPPPPVVLHFNGDKKGYFESKCHESGVAQIMQLGGAYDRCRFIDFPRSRETFVDTQDKLTTRAIQLPPPVPKLNLNQVLAAAGMAATPAEIVAMLFAQFHAPINTAEVASGGLRFGAQGLLDAVVVRRNQTRSTSKYCIYCSVLASIGVAWARLKPSTAQSPGLLWAEFSTADTMRAARKSADSRRPLVECDGQRPLASAAVEGMSGAQAVMDFFESKPPWEFTRFEWEHRHGEGILVALKGYV